MCCGTSLTFAGSSSAEMGLQTTTADNTVNGDQAVRLTIIPIGVYAIF